MNILIVQNKKDDINLLEKLLEEKYPSAKCYGFTNGLEAIEFGKANHIDLLLAYWANANDTIEGCEGAIVAEKLYEFYNNELDYILTADDLIYAYDSWKSDAKGFLLQPFTNKKLEMQLKRLGNNKF